MKQSLAISFRLALWISELWITVSHHFYMPGFWMSAADLSNDPRACAASTLAKSSPQVRLF